MYFLGSLLHSSEICSGSDGIFGDRKCLHNAGVSFDRHYRDGGRIQLHRNR